MRKRMVPVQLVRQMTLKSINQFDSTKSCRSLQAYDPGVS